MSEAMPDLRPVNNMDSKKNNQPNENGSGDSQPEEEPVDIEKGIISGKITSIGDPFNGYRLVTVALYDSNLSRKINPGALIDITFTGEELKEISNNEILNKIDVVCETVYDGDNWYSEKAYEQLRADKN